MMLEESPLILEILVMGGRGWAAPGLSLRGEPCVQCKDEQHSRPPIFTGLIINPMST